MGVMGVPLNHPFYFRIFHEINQPATVGARNPSPPKGWLKPYK